MVALSSLDVAHLARELAILQDAFVDKAYQTGPKEFLLRLRHKERGRYNLVVRPGKWAALAPETPETPDQPSQFAMALRKALANARVRSVSQNEFDRVLVIDLERGGDPFRLVLEFFGQGNLIVVAGDGRIILPWRTETFRHRVVKRGETFKFPPTRQGPHELQADDLANRAKASTRDIVRFLAVEAGLGGDLAEASLLKAGIDKATPAVDVDAQAFGTVIQALRGFLEHAAEPRVLEGEKGPVLASVPLPQHDGSGSAFAMLSDAILAAVAAEPDEAEDEEAPDPEIERLVRQKGHQDEGTVRLKEEAEALEAAAQEIYEKYADFERLLASVRNAVDEQGWDELAALASRGKAEAVVKNVDPAAKRLRIRWAGQTIDVDPEASVETNASTVFDQAKRLREKIEGAKEAVAQTDAAIKRARKKRSKIHKEEKQEQSLSRRTFWFMGYRWFYTTEGFLVIGGRDAASNEKVVKKHMKHGDLYFHADVHGAPSCVLKTEGNEPGETSIEEAARFAAVFSKAFNQFASGDAYYVTPEQVSKTPQTGEFVPKGAFIIRGSRTYRKDLPMEAGVGIVWLDNAGAPTTPGEGHRHVMGGPWVAVQQLCSDAVRVVRGDGKPSDVARQVARRLGAPMDSVVAAMPSANLAIQEAGA